MTGDKCLAIRLRCKPPPPEWPVTYPYECPEGIKRCPVRAIDDVENYLRSVLQAPPKTERESLNGSYLERHVSVNEPDPENQEDHQRVYPAVWFPPHVRNFFRFLIHYKVFKPIERFRKKIFIKLNIFLRKKKTNEILIITLAGCATISGVYRG